jgi:hypothetical protein
MIWSQKLEQLARKTLSLGAIPAITLRSPLKAIVSLQREYWKKLGPLERASATIFSRSHQAQVFNYRVLLKSMERAGFNELLIMNFDTLMDVGLDLAQVIGCLQKNSSFLKLGKHNVGSPDKRQSRFLERCISSWCRDYEKLSSARLDNFRSSPIQIRELLRLLDS